MARINVIWQIDSGTNILRLLTAWAEVFNKWGIAMTTAWIRLSQNIGKTGPDDGIIQDEYELIGIARITMERKTHKKTHEVMFAVTITIYDKMITTSYFHNEEDATEHIETAELLIQVGFVTNV
jgi:hypothetical protein